MCTFCWFKIWAKVAKIIGKESNFNAPITCADYLHAETHGISGIFQRVPWIKSMNFCLNLKWQMLLTPKNFLHILIQTMNRLNFYTKKNIFSAQFPRVNVKEIDYRILFLKILVSHTKTFNMFYISFSSSVSHSLTFFFWYFSYC